MASNLTRADIAAKVSRNIGLSFEDSSNIVDSIITYMCDAIANDGILKLSSFGTFNVKHKAARKGRNLRTNEEVVIVPRDVVIFHASRTLTTYVNN